LLPIKSVLSPSNTIFFIVRLRKADSYILPTIRRKFCFVSEYPDMMEAKEKELIEKAGFSLKEFEAWNSIVNDYGLETKTPPPPAPPDDIYFWMHAYIDHLGADYLLFGDA